MTNPRLIAGFSGAALIALALAAPAAANPSGWGGPSMDRSMGTSDWGRSSSRIVRNADRDREGKVEVTRFVAEGEAAQALGAGPIAVITRDDGAQQGLLDGQTQSATYEAAIIDQLANAGYDTLTRAPGSGQVAELHITRREIVPAEGKRDKVSGETTVGISNRGSMMGMALHVDLTKPAAALVGTRLEARIRDRASAEVLWEGRADIATRADDEDWTEQDIATRLAAALFDEFPGNSGETRLLR